MMRNLSTLLLVLVLGLAAGTAAGQSCTGLACQQTTCSGNATTSISGVVYAPNGTDPLPNVTVYIPNAPVEPFTSGVSCRAPGTPPSGSPLVSTTTAVDGSFTLDNVPVGSNIPLVIVRGKWRRQLVVPGTTACVNNPLPAGFAAMPQNQSQGDIPLIAIATGASDMAECVLLKMGISQSEFVAPGGTGRINLFGATGAVAALHQTSYQTLLYNSSILNSYDLLMLPCQGEVELTQAQELANLINFANSGGRIYASHYSLQFMYQNPPFDSVADWTFTPLVPSVAGGGGIATVNTDFTAGQTLSTWLQEVGASTAPGQIALNDVSQDTTGLAQPTQPWLSLDGSAMQFTFNTPIAPAGSGVNQCGRVLYDDYHVVNGQAEGILAPPPVTYLFPSECTADLKTPMTPQEKLLEYMLFDLTGDLEPYLTPTEGDFGYLGITLSSPLTFTFTNNSAVATQVTSATLSGDSDFKIASNNCGAVAGDATCQITVVFAPTTVSLHLGTLTVQSTGTTLTASLVGVGTAGYSLYPTSLSFGNQDVGFPTTQTLTLTNLDSSPLPVPPLVATGPFSVSTAACGNSLAANATCPVAITFTPTATGLQKGTLGVNSTNPLYSGLSASFTGNGVDFTLALNPTSGSVVAGDVASTGATLTPIAGYASTVNIGCTIATAASAAVCSLGIGTGSTVPPATLTASVVTTAQYSVVGYTGLGGTGVLWLGGLVGGWLLWRTRRRAGRALRCGLMLGLLAAIGLSTTACTGKLPMQNPTFTPPGNYTVTVTANDGFLVHSATYSLNVAAK
jgi:hypothetical protein